MTFGEVIDGIGKNLGVELVDEGGAAAVQVDGNTIILQAADDDLVLLHADLGEIVPFVHEPSDFNCYFTTDGGAIRVRFDYHAEPEQRAFYQRLIALLEEPAEC